MRIIILPNSPYFWISVLILLALVAGVVLWRWLWPPTIEKLGKDVRYHQALAVYIENLPGEDPSREDRRAALAAATLYLVNEHRIPSAEAAAHMQQVVAAYDREESYELRHAAIAYEEAGEYDAALTSFERAARLQEDHDPADYRFLQQCIARVNGKARRNKNA